MVRRLGASMSLLCILCRKNFYFLNTFDEMFLFFVLAIYILLLSSNLTICACFLQLPPYFLVSCSVCKERVLKGTDSWNEFLFIKKERGNERVLFFKKKLQNFVPFYSSNNLHRYVIQIRIYFFIVCNVYCQLVTYYINISQKL